MFVGVTCSVAPTFLELYPAGWKTRSVLSSDGKNQRSPGPAFMGTLPAAVPIGGLVPTPSGPSGHLPLTGGVGPGPLFTGEGHFGRVDAFWRAKLEWVLRRFPAHFVVAKSALFRTPKYGHPSWRSLAPPLPTEPASLGFGGDPVCFTPPRLVPAYSFSGVEVGRAGVSPARDNSPAPLVLPR